MEAQETEQAKPWTSWDNPVLTPEQWQEVRRACEAGMTLPEAAKAWNVDYEAVKKRAQREEWLTESRIKMMASKLIEKKSQEIAEKIESRSVPISEDGQKRPENALLAHASNLEGSRTRTLAGLAKLAENGIQRAIDANLEIENWQDAKIAADIAMKLHNVGQEGVQVNIAQAFAGMDEGPLIGTGVENGEDERDNSDTSKCYFIDDE